MKERKKKGGVTEREWEGEKQKRERGRRRVGEGIHRVKETSRYITNSFKAFFLLVYHK